MYNLSPRALWCPDPCAPAPHPASVTFEGQSIRLDDVSQSPSTSGESLHFEDQSVRLGDLSEAEWIGTIPAAVPVELVPPRTTPAPQTSAANSPPRRVRIDENANTVRTFDKPGTSIDLSDLELVTIASLPRGQERLRKVRELTRRIQKRPEDAELLRKRGNLLHKLHLHDLAATDFEAAERAVDTSFLMIEAFSDRIESSEGRLDEVLHYRRGLEYEKQKMYELAVADFTEACKLLQGNTRMCREMWLSESKSARGRHEYLQSFAEKARPLYTSLGNTLTKVGRHDDAIECFMLSKKFQEDAKRHVDATEEVKSGLKRMANDLKKRVFARQPTTQLLVMA